MWILASPGAESMANESCKRASASSCTITEHDMSGCDWSSVTSSPVNEEDDEILGRNRAGDDGQVNKPTDSPDERRITARRPRCPSRVNCRRDGQVDGRVDCSDNWPNLGQVMTCGQYTTPLDGIAETINTATSVTSLGGRPVHIVQSSHVISGFTCEDIPNEHDSNSPRQVDIDTSSEMKWDVDTLSVATRDT